MHTHGICWYYYWANPRRIDNIGGQNTGRQMMETGMGLYLEKTLLLGYKKRQTTQELTQKR